MFKNKEREGFALKDAATKIAALSEIKFPTEMGSCPFEDGQSVKFAEVVVVDWSNDKGKSGSYLALKFKDNNNAFALSCPLKTVFAFENSENLLNQENLTELRSKGGLADLMRKHAEFNSAFFSDLENFFKDERKIKITEYYNADRWGRRYVGKLLNIL